MVSVEENDVDCRKLFDSIVEDTDKLLKINILDNYRKDTLTAINERIELIHKDIDNIGDQFVNDVIENIKANAEKKEENDKKEEKEKKEKKDSKEKKDKLSELNAIKNTHEREFYLKLHDLQESIENSIRKTSLVEESVSFFKDKDLQNLLKLSKDCFSFKIPRNISKLFTKKNRVDLDWAKGNKSSNIDNDDSSILKVNGTSCYTYYKTEQTFDDEDVTVEFEYNITTSDNYFYLGVINNSVVESSNCMCCTIANAVYIQPGGDVISSSLRKIEPKLAAAKGKDHIVTIRLLGSEKQVYFKVDDNEELGPYAITGSKFRFVGGSCNTVNGFIKILDAYF